MLIHTMFCNNKLNSVSVYIILELVYLPTFIESAYNLFTFQHKKNIIWSTQCLYYLNYINNFTASEAKQFGISLFTCCKTLHTSTQINNLLTYSVYTKSHQSIFAFSNQEVILNGTEPGNRWLHLHLRTHIQTSVSIHPVCVRESYIKHIQNRELVLCCHT